MKTLLYPFCRSITGVIVYGSVGFEGCNSTTHVGSICGVNKGKISNCNNYAEISFNAKPDSNALKSLNLRYYSQWEMSSNTANIGGICGVSDSTIENCLNHGDVNASSIVYAARTSILGRYATVIFHTDFISGGICGDGSGDITNCSNYGRLEFKETKDPNLALSDTHSGEYKNASAWEIGGITGNNVKIIESCCNYGVISRKRSGATLFEFVIYSGGIVGTGKAVNNCYNLGGGESGIASKANNITNSYSVGSCTYAIAERVGVIENCYYCNTSTKGTNKNPDPSISKSKANMKKESFAQALGEAYEYVENDYPKLKWETMRYNARFAEESVNLAEVNQQKALKVQTTYSGAITYLSSDPSVVTVDSEGVVTAVSEGTAQIYALCGENRARAECTVTVKYDYSLSPAELELTAGETADLSIIVNSTGAAAENLTVSYQSSDKTVATVSKAGKVTAVSAGECTITATVAGNEYACQVSVKPAETEPIVISPALNKSTMSVSVGKTGKLSVENYSGTVTWLSDNTEVASVKAASDSLSATVFGLKQGKATVYAMLSNGTALSCAVTVSGEATVIGDINHDGSFTIADAITLHKYLLTETKTVADWKAGDLDENGKLNAIDLTLMKRKLLES